MTNMELVIKLRQCALRPITLPELCGLWELHSRDLRQNRLVPIIGAGSALLMPCGNCDVPVIDDNGCLRLEQVEYCASWPGRAWNTAGHFAVTPVPDEASFDEALQYHWWPMCYREIEGKIPRPFLSSSAASTT